MYINQYTKTNLCATKLNLFGDFFIPILLNHIPHKLLRRIKSFWMIFLTPFKNPLLHVNINQIFWVYINRIFEISRFAFHCVTFLSLPFIFFSSKYCFTNLG